MNSAVRMAMETMDQGPWPRGRHVFLWLDERRVAVEVLIKTKGTDMAADFCGIDRLVFREWAIARNLIRWRP